MRVCIWCVLVLRNVCVYLCELFELVLLMMLSVAFVVVLL